MPTMPDRITKTIEKVKKSLPEVPKINSNRWLLATVLATGFTGITAAYSIWDLTANVFPGRNQAAEQARTEMAEKGFPKPTNEEILEASNTKNELLGKVSIAANNFDIEGIQQAITSPNVIKAKPTQEWLNQYNQRVKELNSQAGITRVRTVMDAAGAGGGLALMFGIPITYRVTRPERPRNSSLARTA